MDGMACGMHQTYLLINRKAANLIGRSGDETIPVSIKSPKSPIVVLVIGLTALEFDNLRRVVDLTHGVDDAGVVVHLEDGWLVLVLIVEAVRSIARELEDVLLNLVVVEEERRALAIAVLVAVVACFLGHADVGYVGAELPFGIVLGIPQSDDIVLRDAKDPTAEVTVIVVLAKGLTGRDAVGFDASVATSLDGISDTGNVELCAFIVEKGGRNGDERIWNNN